MKVTYNWLKDFVEIKISPQALADKLTMSGLEVTSLEERSRDFVFEIEVTSNRPDCLSVIGIAREVAAITGKKLKVDSRDSVIGYRLLGEHRTPNTEHRNIGIKIEDKKDCPLYTAKIITDVKVGPSPTWLKKRLELIGCRTINNIADITNYVLFEWGEPLHAFDLDKLVGPSCYPDVSPEIVVRRARKSEEIVTIDGIERLLDENILVIASGVRGTTNRVVAVAGVMGGKDTEVTKDTKNVLLEAAVFNPTLIRHARQILGLQSESAYRFERGIDLKIVDTASLEATALISAKKEGKLVSAKSSGTTYTKKKNILLDTQRVTKILGTQIKSNQIKEILINLGFQVKPGRKNSFMIGVPSFRGDVNLQIDLIEEISRIFGFTKIPATLPAIKPQVATYTIRESVSLIKNILIGLGLNEVITYSLIAKELLAEFNLKEDLPAIEILNPLSKEQAVLRPILALSLAQSISYNLNQKQENANIFEVAKVFKEEGGAGEELTLGIALCGTKSYFISGGGTLKDSVGPLHVKGILEVVFRRLGINNYSFKPNQDNQVMVLVKQEKIGGILCLPNNILERLEIKNKEVCVAEISLDRLYPSISLKKKVAPLPLYPGITRDMSLVLKEEILVEDILETIREKADPLLKKVEIVDYYRGKQIPPGSKGLTISCLYRSDERTLTEAEITPLHQNIALLLTKEFNAQIRARE